MKIFLQNNLKCLVINLEMVKFIEKHNFQNHPLEEMKNQKFTISEIYQTFRKEILIIFPKLFPNQKKIQTHFIKPLLYVNLQSMFAKKKLAADLNKILNYIYMYVYIYVS